MCRRHIVTYKLGAIFVGLAVGLGLAEGILRLKATVDGPDAVRSAKVDLSGAEGARILPDALRSRAGAPNVVRIAFVGDSYTFGLDVEPNATFVRQLNLLLDRRYPGRYVTINLAASGADVISEWLLLNGHIDAWRPHVVVQVLSWNDLDVDLYQDVGPITEFIERRLWLSRHSLLFSIGERKIRTALMRSYFIDYLRGGATAEKRERAWRIVTYGLAQTKRLVEGSGAKYVLVSFPRVSYLDYYPTPLGEVHRQTAVLAGRLGVPYLDLFPVFRGHESSEMALRGDGHPTVGAHAIAAEAIEDFLVRSVLHTVPAHPMCNASRPRTDPEVLDASTEFLRQVLKVDPTCGSARFFLRSCQGKGDMSSLD